MLLLMLRLSCGNYCAVHSVVYVVSIDVIDVFLVLSHSIGDFNVYIRVEKDLDNVRSCFERALRCCVQFTDGCLLQAIEVHCPCKETAR